MGLQCSEQRRRDPGNVRFGGGEPVQEWAKRTSPASADRKGMVSWLPDACCGWKDALLGGYASVPRID